MFTQLGKLTRCALLLALAMVVAVPVLYSSNGETVLRGHLDKQAVQSSTSKDQPLPFHTDEGKTYQVSGDSISAAQLRDPLLVDRHWELRGFVQPDGRFEITKLFTIKDGKLYRVTYYCDICHIVTHEPGDCMCCQKVTELRETPAE